MALLGADVLVAADVALVVVGNKVMGVGAVVVVTATVVEATLLVAAVATFVGAAATAVPLNTAAAVPAALIVGAGFS